jgi:hypothetical protein
MHCLHIRLGTHGVSLHRIQESVNLPFSLWLQHDATPVGAHKDKEKGLWLISRVWKITMLLRTVNHLFLWTIFHFAMLVITRG